LIGLASSIRAVVFYEGCSSKIEMVEYYVGLLPIGLFQSLEKVTTYVCKECGRIIFYAKEFPGRYSGHTKPV
jgi:hypothetical protein